MIVLINTFLNFLTPVGRYIVLLSLLMKTNITWTRFFMSTRAWTKNYFPIHHHKTCNVGNRQNKLNKQCLSNVVTLSDSSKNPVLRVVQAYTTFHTHVYTHPKNFLTVPKSVHMITTNKFKTFNCVHTSTCNNFS